MKEDQSEGVETLSMLSSASGLIRGEKGEEKERDGGIEGTVRSVEDLQTEKKEKEEEQQQRQREEELSKEEREDKGIIKEGTGEISSGRQLDPGGKPVEESEGSVSMATASSIPVDKDHEVVLIAGEERREDKKRKKSGDERDEVEATENDKKVEEEETEKVKGIGDEREVKDDEKLKEKDRNVKHKGKKAGGIGGTSAHIEWRVVLHFRGIRDKKVFASVDEETVLGSLLRQALLPTSSGGKAEENRRDKKRRLRNQSDHVPEAGTPGGEDTAGTEHKSLGVCHEEQQKKGAEERDDREKKKRRTEEEGDGEGDEEGRREGDLCKVDDEVDIELDEFRKQLTRHAESSTAIEMEEREEISEKEKTPEEDVCDQSCDGKKRKAESSSSLSGAAGEASPSSSVHREGATQDDDPFSLYHNRIDDLSLLLSWTEIPRSSSPYSCSPPPSVPPPPSIVPTPAATHSNNNNNSSSSSRPGAPDNCINIVDSSSLSPCPSPAVSSPHHLPSGNASATGGARLPLPCSPCGHLPSPASEREHVSKEKNSSQEDESAEERRRRTTPVRKCELTWTLRHALRGSTVLEVRMIQVGFLASSTISSILSCRLVFTENCFTFPYILARICIVIAFHLEAKMIHLYFLVLPPEHSSMM